MIKTVSFADKKYTLELDEYKLTALRNGESWQDFTGNKLMYLMTLEIYESRKRLEQIHSWIVCAPIATAKDMMQSAELIEQLSNLEVDFDSISK